MQITGYAWACLSVRDLERSVAWYRRAFGLDMLMTNADTCAIGAQDQFVYLVDPTSLFVLGLQQRADNNRRRFHAAVTGLDHLTIAVGTAGLNSYAQHLAEIGIPYTGPTRWQAGTLIELTDPDGIPVRLFELSGPPPSP